MLQECRGSFAVGCVTGFGLFDRLPETGQHFWQVGAELLLGLAKILNLREFIIQEARYQAMEFGRLRHVDAHSLSAVLE